MQSSNSSQDLRGNYYDELRRIMVKLAPFVHTYSYLVDT